MAKKMLPHQHNEIHEMEKLGEQISKTSDFDSISEVFRQLGDSTRLRIFWLLCHCEECVTDIASMLEMSSPAVSHHLKVLKECNLINSLRVGKEVYYKATDTAQSKLMHRMMEQTMEIVCPTEHEHPERIHSLLLSSGVQHSQQEDIIRKVHDYTLEHLDERITIEELAREFLMNPTTLKAEFKAVYGESIAAHTKEHRMEHAAALLSTTDLSLSEISKRVGYESQSKFTAAFKEFYKMLPSEFRKTK